MGTKLVLGKFPLWGYARHYETTSKHSGIMPAMSDDVCRLLMLTCNLQGDLTKADSSSLRAISTGYKQEVSYAVGFHFVVFKLVFIRELNLTIPYSDSWKHHETSKTILVWSCNPRLLTRGLPQADVEHQMFFKPRGYLVTHILGYHRF